MELVDAPAMAPGVCALTSQGGTLIDTKREIAQIGRAYLHPDVVRDAAAAIGMVGPEELERALLDNAELVEVLVMLNGAYLEVLDDYNRLRGAMCELLQHGATVDRRGVIRYREVKPGDRRAKE